MGSNSVWAATRLWRWIASGAVVAAALLAATVLSVAGALLMTTAAGAQLRYLHGADDPALGSKGVLDTPEIELVARLPPGSLIRKAARPVGRLRVQSLAAGGVPALTFCTGVLIAEEILLTAYHCLPGWFGLRVESARVEFTEPERPGGSIAYPVSPEPLEASAELDYALLRVRGRPGARFGQALLARRPAGQGEAVFLVHYPRGGPQAVTRANCRVHRRSMTDLLHSCDTSWGSSGAPIFSARTGRVVGLHYAGNRQANYGRQATALVRGSALLARIAPAPLDGGASKTLGGGGLAEAGNALARSLGRAAMMAFLGSVGPHGPAPKTLLALEALERRGPTDGASNLGLELWTGKPVGVPYREGDGLNVHARCARDCNLKLVYVDAAGAATVIFPNGFQREGFRPAGRGVRIPGPGAPFAIVIGPPFGVEALWAFASSAPLPPDRGPGPGGGMVRIGEPILVYAARQRAVKEAKAGGRPVRYAEARIEFRTAGGPLQRGEGR